MRIIRKVNGVDLLTLNEQGEKLVPIKPICEAIGVAPFGQREKIQNDPILGSVGKLSLSTGKDKKEYEMFCLPYRYIFGWLFSINANNVKPEAKEGLIKYQRECYDALFDHFVGKLEVQQEKNSMEIKLLERLNELKEERNVVNSEINSVRGSLNKLRDERLSDHSSGAVQPSLFSDENGKGD